MNSTNKNFVAAWYEDVWNKGDETAIDRMFHTEGKVYGLGAEAIVGPAGFKPFYNEFRNNFSDIQVSVDELYEEGDTVTAKCTVTAKHTATGKPVNFTGSTIAVIKDNMLMSGWNHFDFLAMYLQIGKINPEQLM